MLWIESKQQGHITAVDKKKWLVTLSNFFDLMEEGTEENIPILLTFKFMKRYNFASSPVKSHKLSDLLPLNFIV